MKRRAASYSQTPKEARRIARKSTPFHIIVYAPQTEQGKRELAVRAAEVHADAASRAIGRLNCPSEQKIKLLRAVVEQRKKQT